MFMFEDDNDEKKNKTFKQNKVESSASSSDESSGNGFFQKPKPIDNNSDIHITFTNSSKIDSSSPNKEIVITKLYLIQFLLINKLKPFD